MKRIYLGLILICTFVFVGCSEKIGDKFYPSENYVTRYQDPLSSYAAVYGSIDEYPVPSQSVVQFMINLRVTESTANSLSYDVIDRKTDVTRFKELAQKFNDTEYNKINFNPPPPVMYVQSESLNIVSDQDYDATHPAGSSLNDLFLVKYTSVDHILQNHYDMTRTEQQVELGLAPWEFMESVDAFNQKQPTLVWFYFWFYPTERPTGNKQHRFTITYKNVEGKELVATTLPVLILEQEAAPNP